jgi:uncharacterized membrane protein
MSEHARKRDRNGDIVAFGRSRRDREAKTVNNFYRTHVVLTAVLLAGMIAVAVIAATKSSSAPYELLSYVSEIVLIGFIIAFGWLVFFVRRSRLKIYDQFLKERGE